MRTEKERTNALHEATIRTTGHPVNDIGFRLILIPAFGIIIPLITGMINSQNFHHWQIKLGFLYTIFIALVIWEGNRYLHFSLRSYFDWINKPIQKIAVLILSITFYTIPVSMLLLLGWYRIFMNGNADWPVITECTLIIMISVLFITHVYETVFLVKESENEMIRNEQLERARVEAELEALKNQIDPHFIFNSLNTLSHLIEENPAKAKCFNDSLAEVYRYILLNKARDLVLLRDELSFVDNYFLLLKIRFEKAVQLKIFIDEDCRDHFLIPPISLQSLAENAIKHNEFSDMLPLVLTITMRNEELVIHNRVSKKDLRKTSSRIGLHNLRERYKLTTDKNISVSEDDGDFIVRLPVLKMA
jgi:sensor histidine kinase YesM